jgi:hypothetical protein
MKITITITTHLEISVFTIFGDKLVYTSSNFLKFLPKDKRSYSSCVTPNELKYKNFDRRFYKFSWLKNED